MKNDSIKIITLDDKDFVDKSSGLITDLIADLILEKGEISVALSGGNSPLPIYKKLSTLDINWDKIKFFTVDERCVSVNHSESNYGNIRKLLFDKVLSKSFSMVVENLNYHECASKYEEIIKTNISFANGIPQLDLVILGMGLDGHTASLFPDTKALLNTSDLVVLNHVPQLKTERITMTYPLLLNAKKIVLIAPGQEKKKVLDNIFDNNYPISKIIPQIDLILN